MCRPAKTVAHKAVRFAVINSVAERVAQAQPVANLVDKGRRWRSHGGLLHDDSVGRPTLHLRKCGILSLVSIPNGQMAAGKTNSHEVSARLFHATRRDQIVHQPEVQRHVIAGATGRLPLDELGL